MMVVPLRTRIVSSLFVAIPLLVGAAPLCARQPQAPVVEEPQFLIETITVENAEKFSTHIIVAESLLEDGHSYSEKELRDAVYRIVRLPLILDAEFSLRRGSERDHYELVITVWETRRWFFGASVAGILWDQPVSVSGLTTTDNTVSIASLAGRRFSVGRHGVFFLASGGQDGLQAGYAHYNLFGRSILVSLSYSISGCANGRPGDDRDDAREDGCQTQIFDLGLDPSFAAWTAQGAIHRGRFSLGIPLRGNHSLRLVSSFRSTDVGLRRQAHTPDLLNAYSFDNRQEFALELSWVYNSIDDPIFPTSGHFLEAGLDHRRLDTRLRSLAGPFPLPPRLIVESESEVNSLRVSGERHWPLSERESFTLGAGAAFGGSKIEDLPLVDRLLVSDEASVWEGDVTLKYSQFLWRVTKRPKWRELRWESEVEGFFHGTSPDFDQRGNPRSGYRVGSGLVFRNTWGVFRMQLNYLDSSSR